MSTTTRTLITAAAFSLPFLAACGSQPAPHAAARTAAPARQVSTAPPGPQGYQDATTLQRSVKHVMNAKARRRDYAIRARSVNCIEQGPQKATCLVDFSGDGGTSTTVHVVIAADGSSWISH